MGWLQTPVKCNKETAAQWLEAQQHLNGGRKFKGGTRQRENSDLQLKENETARQTGHLQNKQGSTPGCVHSLACTASPAQPNGKHLPHEKISVPKVKGFTRKYKFSDKATSLNPFHSYLFQA